MSDTVHGTQYTVHGTQYMVHSTWYTVHGTQYIAHSTQTAVSYAIIKHHKSKEENREAA